MAKIKKGIKKGLKKQVISIKGVRTSELLKMDTYNLNKSSLKVVLSRLIHTANQRIKRLEKRTPNSPSLISFKNVNKPFTIRGLSYNDMEIMMKRVKNFLNTQTSTIKGFKEHKKNVVERIGEFEDENQETEFWHIYNKWIENHPNIAVRFNDTNELQAIVYDNFVVKEKTARGTSASVTRAVKKMLGEIVDKQNKDNLINQDVLMNDGIKQHDF